MPPLRTFGHRVNAKPFGNGMGVQPITRTHFCVGEPILGDPLADGLRRQPQSSSKLLDGQDSFRGGKLIGDCHVKVPKVVKLQIGGASVFPEVLWFVHASRVTPYRRTSLWLRASRMHSLKHASQMEGACGMN